jgi:hypothetical protein
MNVRQLSIPEVRIDLSQAQRRALAQMLRFSRKPRHWTEARWRVVTFGAASSLSSAEMGDLSDLLSVDLQGILRSVDRALPE